MKRQFKNNLSKPSGFGLLETMMAIGVTAVLILGTLQMVRLVWSNYQSVQMSAEAEEVLTEIRTALKDRATCKEVLTSVQALSKQFPDSWNEVDIGDLVWPQMDGGNPSTILSRSKFIRRIRAKSIKLVRVSDPYPISYRLEGSGQLPSIVGKLNKYYANLKIILEKESSGNTQQIGGNFFRQRSLSIVLAIGAEDQTDYNLAKDELHSCYVTTETKQIQELCMESFNGEWTDDFNPHCHIQRINFGLGDPKENDPTSLFKIADKNHEVFSIKQDSSDTSKTNVNLCNNNGIPNGSCNVHVDGIIYSKADIFSSGEVWGGHNLSDIRFKNNISPITNAIDKILSLHAINFNFAPTAKKYFKIDESKRESGLIAQEVEKIIPEASGEFNGIKLVKYDKIVPYLVSSQQNLYMMLKDQQQEILKYKQELEQLKNQLANK